MAGYCDKVDISEDGLNPVEAFALKVCVFLGFLSIQQEVPKLIKVSKSETLEEPI